MAGSVNYVSGNNSLFATTNTNVVTTPKTEETTDTTGALTGQKDPSELKEQFLEILLVQLENQNPLDPVNPTEFTNQLALYSSLEQQINMNAKFDDLLEALQGSASTSAFSYIGNSAELATNMTSLQDGKADWKYALGEDAKTVKISVINQAGQTVYQEDVGASPAGTYSINLNAEDFLSDVADGEILKLKIDAANMEGKAASTEISTQVTIDGVETADGNIVLRAGNLSFAIDDVERIVKAQTTTPTTT